jgi:hypothetical protein
VKYRVRTALGCGFTNKTRRGRKQQYNAMQCKTKQKEEENRAIYPRLDKNTTIKQTQER